MSGTDEGDQPKLSLLHVGDQHFDVTPPRSRKDDYFQAIKNKFIDIRTIAHDLGVDIITWSGDMINRKEAHRVPYALTNWLIEYFSTFNDGYGPTDHILNVIAMGNHDVHQRAHQWHRQPIGTIVKSGCVIPLWTDPTTENPTGYVRVQVATKSPDFAVALHGRMHSYGADTDAGRASNYSVSRIMGEAGFDIAVIHTHLLPNGSRFIADYSTPDHIDAVVRKEDRPDLYLCGHVHDDHGIFGGDGYRCLNYGAISRGSIDEYNLQRSVKVGLIAISLAGKGKHKVDISPIPLPSALPAKEVFYMEELSEKRRKAAAIVHTDFKLTADNIRDTFSIVSPDEAVTMAFTAVGAPKRVEDRVRGYIDRARQAIK